MSNGTDAEPVLEVVETGQGVSLQDLGRRGWKRYGVPPGGALDPHAAQWANLLLDNPLDTPVLECLLAGARFRALREVEVAITGAAASGETQRWGTTKLGPDEELALPPPVAGVWTYLAVRGGFRATHWFGSVSVFPRGGLGEPPGPGARLFAPAETTTRPPRLTSVGARWLDPRERRDYRRPPAIRVWPGPQWDLFTETARAAFFDTAWRVSARSDRTGYRLEGRPIAAAAQTIPSEPVLPGSIQVPPDGRPIVTMADGPTVGGYPKLALVEPADLGWLAQCRAGQAIGFVLAT